MKLKEWYDYKLDETQQKLLDEDVEVYDLKAYIRQETEDLEEPFWFKKIAIFQGPRKNGCYVDYEAVGNYFSSVSDEIEIDTNDYDPEEPNVIYLRPTGSFKCKIIDIIDSAPMQVMKGKDFFTKATYNDRCYDNYCELVEYLDKIGYFGPHKVDAGLESDASLANDANVDSLLEGNLAIWTGPNDEIAEYHMELLPIDPDLPLEDFLKLLEDNGYEVYDNMTEAEFYEDDKDPELDNTTTRCYLYNPSMARNWCFSSKEAMYKWFTKSQNTNNFRNCCTSKPLDEGLSLKEGRYSELSKQLARVEDEIKELRKTIKETKDEAKLDELFDELAWKEVEKGDLEGALAEIRYLDNGNANDYSGYESLEEDVKRRVVVQPHSGISADGFNIYVYEGDKLISKTDYRYGYNASYSKELADKAHKLVQDNVKYGWNNSYYNEKPYVRDILEKVAKENGLSIDELEFIDGKYVFNGNTYPADKFKKEFLNESSDKKSAKELEEPKLETFEDKMNFLAKDEQEAIDGYDKVISLLDPEKDAIVIEQLNKIKVEEIAHKKYAEDVINNHDLVYTEPLEPEEDLEEGLETKVDEHGNKYLEFASEEEAKDYFDKNADKLPDGAVMYVNKIYFGKDGLEEDIEKPDELKEVLLKDVTDWVFTGIGYDGTMARTPIKGQVKTKQDIKNYIDKLSSQKINMPKWKRLFLSSDNNQFVWVFDIDKDGKWESSKGDYNEFKKIKSESLIESIEEYQDELGYDSFKRLDNKVELTFNDVEKAEKAFDKIKNLDNTEARLESGSKPGETKIIYWKKELEEDIEKHDELRESNNCKIIKYKDGKQVDELDFDKEQEASKWTNACAEVNSNKIDYFLFKQEKDRIQGKVYKKDGKVVSDKSTWANWNEWTLDEDIEKHDTLNPKLFDGEELKPEVKETIEKIANEFISELNEDGINFTLKDIVLLGSNVSYNYTKDSDLDIHLIADSNSLECPTPLLDKLYGAYRSIFNKNYDITIKGIPVEIFVELDEPRAKSNGIYSLNTGWVKKPEQTAIPDLDKEAFDSLFGEWEERYNKLIGE